VQNSLRLVLQRVKVLDAITFCVNPRIAALRTDVSHFRCSYKGNPENTESPSVDASELGHDPEFFLRSLPESFFTTLVDVCRPRIKHVAAEGRARRRAYF
jgi:hypothetical protein